MRTRFFIFSFLFFFIFSSCQKKIIPPLRKVCMDTVCSVNLYEDGSKKLYDEIFKVLENFEKEFSISIPDSALSEVNRCAGIRPVPVSQNFYTLLEISNEVSKISDGAFDVSLNPLIQLWNISSDLPHVPKKNEIDMALEKTGFQKLRFSGEDIPWIHLEHGMSLNFGAIAKGYAADMVCQILKENNVQKAVVDLGGNIFCYGKKSDGSLWTVGIKNPDDPSGVPLLKLRTSETSIVTSGIYERYFEEDGKRYHHILDPQTGYPSENELASVTVICPVSTLADGFSTAFFVMGQKRTLEALEDLKKKIPIDVVFIHKDGNVYATEGLVDKLTFYGDREGSVYFCPTKKLNGGIE